jgi:hypothetical protein
MSIQTHTTPTPPPYTAKTREELLADRVYFSLDPQDVNCITPEQHALLLDVVDFLTPEHVQTYFVDFIQNKTPCCCRTLYIYLTKVLNDPKMVHLAHYRHNGQIVHVLDFYKQAMASERRRNNDVFGRSVLIQVRLGPDSWVPIKMGQIMLCFMVHQLHLFDHIGEFLEEIKHVMQKTEADKKKLTDLTAKTAKTAKLAKLAKKSMITTQTLDFHMMDQDDWKIRLGVETNGLKKETNSGIDFFMY